MKQCVYYTICDSYVSHIEQNPKLRKPVHIYVKG